MEKLPLKVHAELATAEKKPVTPRQQIRPWTLALAAI